MFALLKRISPSVLIFLFFFSVYSFTMTGWVQYGDEIEKYRVAQSIVERGEFSFRPTQERANYGVDGKNYSMYEFGQTLFEIPLYALGKIAYTFFPPPDPNQITLLFVGFLNPILTALTCVLLYQTSLSLGWQKRTALVLVFLFGLATIALPYSKSFMREPLLALLLLLSVYTVLRFDQTRQSRWLLAAGLASGYLVFTKFIHAVVVPVILLDIALLIYAQSKSFHAPQRDRLVAVLKGVGWFLSPAILLLAFQVLYGFARFGTFYSGIAGTKVNPLEIIYGLFILSTPVQGVIGLLVSPEKSIFLYSPPIVLAVLGFPALFRRNKNITLLILVLLAAEFASAIFRSAWEGGNWWGARYVGQTTSLFILAIGALENVLFDKKPWRVVVGLLFILGILVQLVGAFANDRDYLDVTGQGPYLIGHLDFLRHGALDSLLIYLSPTGLPIQMNPYGIVLIALAAGLGVLVYQEFGKREPSSVSALASGGLFATVIVVQAVAFVFWVVAPYSQVWAARANTKFVAAETFLANGRVCEAVKFNSIALDRGTTFVREAGARIENLAPRATGIDISANDLMTTEDRKGDAVLSKDTENSIAGEGALKASTSTRQDVVIRGVSFPVTVKPNTMYQLSGWIRTENIYGTGYGVVTVNEDNGAWGNPRVTDIINLDETRGWLPFRKMITVLPTTRRVFVAAGLWQTYGTFWVDGVRLAEVTATTVPSVNLSAPCLQKGILKSDLITH